MLFLWQTSLKTRQKYSFSSSYLCMIISLKGIRQPIFLQVCRIHAYVLWVLLCEFNLFHKYTRMHMCMFWYYTMCVHNVLVHTCKKIQIRLTYIYSKHRPIYIQYIHLSEIHALRLLGGSDSLWLYYTTSFIPCHKRPCLDPRSCIRFCSVYTYSMCVAVCEHISNICNACQQLLLFFRIHFFCVFSHNSNMA